MVYCGCPLLQALKNRLCPLLFKDFLLNSWSSCMDILVKILREKNQLSEFPCGIFEISVKMKSAHRQTRAILQWFVVLAEHLSNYGCTWEIWWGSKKLTRSRMSPRTSLKLAILSRFVNLVPVRPLPGGNEVTMSLLAKQKFGFIKRVDKGWITTVKDLESLAF